MPAARVLDAVENAPQDVELGDHALWPTSRQAVHGTDNCLTANEVALRAAQMKKAHRHETCALVQVC